MPGRLMVRRKTLNLIIGGSTPPSAAYVLVVQWIGLWTSNPIIRVQISAGTHVCTYPLKDKRIVS